jgi:hypothetical protein
MELKLKNEKCFHCDKASVDDQDLYVYKCRHWCHERCTCKYSYLYKRHCVRCEQEEIQCYLMDVLALMYHHNASKEIKEDVIMTLITRTQFGAISVEALEIMESIINQNKAEKIIKGLKCFFSKQEHTEITEEGRNTAMGKVADDIKERVLQFKMMLELLSEDVNK